MKRVKVALGARSYDAVIGAGAVAGIHAALPKGLRRAGQLRAVIIADRRLARARAELRRALRRSGWEVREIPVRAGEALKDIASVMPVYAELLRAKADRHSVLFALGGGSVGDAAGFIASTYMRGIPWVGVPTTLLAQVDSSLGGKTAVNHAVAKNLIGTTYQPSLVVCDTDFLRTLSRREVISGLGEIVKYGIIYDPKFLRFLERAWPRFLAGDEKALAYAIERSLAWKARVVSADEQDRTGVREALNFGHTFGHALEAATRFRRYQHGEAVIWGMRFALALSEVRGWLRPTERARVDGLLRKLRVPGIPASLRPAAIFALMKKDKKIQSGQVRFVLLRLRGARRPEIISDPKVTPRDLQAAFRLMLMQEGESHGA